ncbi:caspase domain-containing protein [Russula earlei]|uniref:Caspase domain-containing protein n=1 Tax=Russula earlei TaxID=71964 RepID=A0ACC0UPC7_9AGAM|nr:caspase domain-containing protein [Russula earlei]
MIEGREINLWALHKAVFLRNGFESVTTNDEWSIIGSVLGFPPLLGVDSDGSQPTRCWPDIARKLQNLYRDVLRDFDQAYISFVISQFRFPPAEFRTPFSRCPRKKRALVIGINSTQHPDPRIRLEYCVEDAYSIANFLRDNLGIAHDDLCVMTDNDPYNYPTKENIMMAMSELVRDAQPHDSLFCYFSGHAVQIEDLLRDEPDGLADCLCTVASPHESPFLIVDDTMHHLMVEALPRNCRLTAIFDSCDSGTLLDLPYLYNSHGIVKEYGHSDRLTSLHQKSRYADVVSLSAPKSHQETLETRRGGALRLAFIDCMNRYENHVTCEQLIRRVCDLTGTRSSQRPLLSSSHEIDTNLRTII